MSFTLLHEPYPWRASSACGTPARKTAPVCRGARAAATPGERPPFPSYWHAFLDLFRSLADPRVGAQWRVAKLRKAGRSWPKQRGAGSLKCWRRHPPTSSAMKQASPNPGLLRATRVGVRGRAGLRKDFDDGQVQALRGVDFPDRQGRVRGPYRSERLWKDHLASDAVARLIAPAGCLALSRELDGSDV